MSRFTWGKLIFVSGVRGLGAQKTKTPLGTLEVILFFYRVNSQNASFSVKEIEDKLRNIGALNSG